MLKRSAACTVTEEQLCEKIYIRVTKICRPASIQRGVQRSWLNTKESIEKYFHYILGFIRSVHVEPIFHDQTVILQTTMHTGKEVITIVLSLLNMQGTVDDGQIVKAEWYADGKY